MLKIENLYVKFGNSDNYAVQDFSCQLKRGEIVGIVGESGAGKSTVAKAIMNILPKDCDISGDIYFDDKMISKMPESEFTKYRGKKIAIVFQNTGESLTPYFTIEHQFNSLLKDLFDDNDKAGWRRAKGEGRNAKGVRRNAEGVGRRARRNIIENLLNSLSLKPEEILRKYPFQLCGGEKQRIVIGMAIASNPDLLIADEPTTGIDSILKKELIDLLRKLNKDNHIAIVFISHDLYSVHQLSDKIIVMDKGKVVKDSDELKNGSAKSVRRSAKSVGRNCNLNTTTFCENNTSQLDKSSNILEIKGLTKSYNRSNNNDYALKDISLSLKPHESLGIVGQSGSGKTTLAKCILRLIKYDSGLICYMGNNCNRKSVQLVRENIKIVFQNPKSSLNSRKKIITILKESIKSMRKISTKPFSDNYEDLMDIVNLPHNTLHKYPDELSGGEAQRVSIARALAVSPSILIADEPVSSLDESNKIKIIELLNSLKEKIEMSIILISHNLFIVRKLVDKIIILQNGNFIEMNTTENIFNNSQNEYTKKLIESGKLTAISRYY